MVDPAWAVAEIATSGKRREIARRCLVDMFRLHDDGSAVMCASTHEFGVNCPPVTGSRRRENEKPSSLRQNINPLSRLRRCKAQSAGSLSIADRLLSSAEPVTVARNRIGRGREG